VNFAKLPELLQHRKTWGSRLAGIKTAAQPADHPAANADVARVAGVNAIVKMLGF
jgi:hypothetical protein